MIDADKVLEVPANLSFASSNLTVKTELRILDKIMKVGVGFLLPPVVITVFSLYTYFQIYNKILLLCPFISAISLIATIFLIKFSKEAKETGLRASNAMFYSLYTLHFCAAAYFFIGFLLVFLFKGDDELLSKINFALLGIEGGGIKYIIGYGLLFLLVRRLTIEYQSISQYIQVMQILLTFCGACIFLTCESYKNRWDNLDISFHVQPVILTLGIIAGTSTMVLSLVTFYGSYTEKFSVLLLSQILNIILMVFLLLLTGILYKSNEIYIEVIDENCDYLLKIMDYSKIQCQKYTDDLCDEQFVASVWESGLEKGEKCVNRKCCWEITEEVVLSLQVCMAWTLLTAVLLAFSWFAGQGLVKKIEKYGKSSEKNFDYKVMVCLVIIYILTGYYWIYIDHSAKLTKNSADVQVIDAELLSNHFIPKDLCRPIELSTDFPDTFDNLLIVPENGEVFPSSFSGKTKKIQESLKYLRYCPSYISQTYEIDLNFYTNNQLSTTHILQESIQDYTKISGEAEGVDALLPGSRIDPSIILELNSSSYAFSVPRVEYAYRLQVLFDQHPVAYTVGGLYPTMPNIILADSEDNLTLAIKSYNPGTVDVFKGLNSAGPLYLQTQVDKGVSSIVLPNGLYTLVSKSIGQINFKKNINLYQTTEVQMLAFPTLMNEAFSVQYLRNSSKLFSQFQLNPEYLCQVSLKLPRCGGARMLKYKNSEIFKVSEISASYYLVYAIGDDFGQESVKFYSKGFLGEHFEVYGKENKSGVWMIMCINGRKGIGSLKVLDYYTEFPDFKACENIYGNLTWSEKEIKKGYIKVEN